MPHRWLDLSPWFGDDAAPSDCRMWAAASGGLWDEFKSAASRVKSCLVFTGLLHTAALCEGTEFAGSVSPELWRWWGC